MNGKINLARIVHLSGNIGDYAQIIGLEQVYKKLNLETNYNMPPFHTDGIHPSEGEQVICPHVGLACCNSRFFERFEKPSWALPVFLGIAFLDMLALDQVQFWLRGSGSLPILCRDQTSADLVKRLGLNGQFWGCASLLLPKREKEPINGKVYACDLDIAPSIKEYIPDNLKHNIIELESQEMDIKGLDKKSNISNQYQKMQEKLQLLCNTARLVITPRVHVALPCIAMGIPVIKISSQREQRLQLIDSFIQSYRATEFGQIDWEPQAPDIEETKQKMLNIACDVVSAAYDRAKENVAINQRITEMQRTGFKKLKKHYFIASYRGYAGLPPTVSTSMDLKKQDFFKRITGKYPENTDLVFYGAGINGMHLLQSLKNLVDVCKSFCFVDSNPDRQGKTYGGYPIKSPESLHEYHKDSLVIFVTPFGCCGGAAEAIAETLENDFSLREGIHFYLYEILMYSTLQECFGLPCVTSLQFRGDKSLGAWEFL